MEMEIIFLLRLLCRLNGLLHVKYSEQWLERNKDSSSVLLLLLLLYDFSLHSACW